MSQKEGGRTQHTLAVASWLLKEQSFGGRNEITLECPYTLAAECSKPGSDHPDVRGLIQWKGVLLVHSSSHPNGQNSRLGVLQRERLTQNRYFLGLIFFPPLKQPQTASKLCPFGLSGKAHYVL